MTLMSNKNTNGTNKNASNKSRKGPKPIRTVAQLREQLLATMMVRELRKIDRKMDRLARQERAAKAKAERCASEWLTLQATRAEYSNEIGGAK